ncbi:hypothetical protein CASFOL_003641 [Castilleja foliolosa]|uniref:AP2/ERF domain-containing protein n=1 Tax=Castilleja foliolosa TaxID=1961234 RepID=A0ABD3EI34_9LAMI
MASSNNNWLGFSLSPQELQNHPQNSVFNTDEISAVQISGDESCFDHLTPASVSANNPLNNAPFAILEAFNRNTHSQDWNMNDLNMGSFSCINQSMGNQERPKLENFLGHSFSDNNHQEHEKICTPNENNISFSNSYNNLCQENESSNSHTNAATNGTIGLSMIKNWMRNNPAPPHAVENKVGGEVVVHSNPAAGAQALSLSMSTGSQSISVLPLLSGGAKESCTSGYNKVQQCGGVAVVDGGGQGGGAVESTPRKSVETFGQRTSIYRGVTRHRWTGRYEAHLWDNSVRREGQTRKGRQVYLGGYDKEEKAARSYDLAALKYWGTTTTTNFPMSNYEKEIVEMKHMTRQEHVASLRRKSSGFSRGASIYRGVTRHHQHGRWQARIGRVAGNKDLYLGTFSTQEEAAEAYDIAAIKFRGLNAVTNFEINRYDVKSILESTTLPIGGAAKRLKDAENAENMALETLHRENEANNLNLQLTDHHHGHINNNNTQNWPMIAFQQPQPLMTINNYPFALHQRSLWCKQEQDSDVNINHHLQLGNTHNFFQPNVMSLDSDHHNVGPIMGPNVFVQDGQHQMENEGGFMAGYEQGMFGSGDVRNLYYHQFQQSSSGLEKTGVYDQGSGCNNNNNDWNNIPTAVPTRNNNGASTFTVWNDT